MQNNENLFPHHIVQNESNFPHWGKKYKIIQILSDYGPYGTTKWSHYLTYDPEANKVLIATPEGPCWIDFLTYIYIMSWPGARTGKWPSTEQCRTPVTEEELAYINENTVDWADREV